MDNLVGRLLFDIYIEALSLATMGKGQYFFQKFME